MLFSYFYIILMPLPSPSVSYRVTQGANDDEARIQKRAIKDTFNAWVDGKKDIERTQRMEAAAAQEAHGNIDFDGFQRRADDAFDKWKVRNTIPPAFSFNQGTLMECPAVLLSVR